MSWTHWHGVKMTTKQKVSICIIAKQGLTIVEMHFFFLGTERIFRGEGNGNPLQYSCLENPMDRGAWWATVHGSQRVRHD